MILYDYTCRAGHGFEAGVASMRSPAPSCPACGADSSKRISVPKLGGLASTGPAREDMPRSWTAVGRGDRELIRRWHDVAERRERLEERHPELAGDRRPILSHEGIFAARPLRAGEDVASAAAEAAAAAAPGRSHDHGAASPEGRPRLRGEVRTAAPRPAARPDAKEAR